MEPTTTVEIMFQHKPSRTVTFCKVIFAKLNWKLRKLQNEGMYVLGVYLKEGEEGRLPITVMTEEASDVRQVGAAVEGIDCGDPESCGCAIDEHGGDQEVAR